MAFMAAHLLSVILVLFMTGKGSEGLCNEDELTNIILCIFPYNDQFLDHFGTNDTACNYTLINPQICQSFGDIVDCVLGKDLNETTCMPTAPQQINSMTDIPCKVEDFFSVCTNVPNPWDNDTTTISDTPTTPANFTTPTDPTNSTTPTTPEDDGDDTGGCGRKSATQYVWMMSLMTTLFAIMKPACYF